MKLRFLFAALAIVLMLVFGAVACGGGDDDGGSPGGSGQDGGGNDDGGGDDDDDGPTEAPTPTIPENLGEELTLEEYFTAIDGIFEAADSATDEAQTDLDAALAAEQPLADQIEAIQDYLATELEVFSDAIGRLDVMNPPDELEADHDDFLQAVMDATGAASGLQFALQDVETEEEATELIDNFEATVTEATGRSDQACFNLQAVADANNIDVDLDCED
jgi:hypothetical protein